jgi:O-antigen/teichoic acid export membrane protein
MSRAHRLLGGVSLGFASQALTLVVGLWLTPFLLGRVGQQDYGLWLLGAQLLAYLMLMDFGIVALLPRATAYATGRAGGWTSSELPELIGQTTRLVFWQMPFVALAAVALWLLLPHTWAGLRGPLALVLVTFVVMFPFRILQAALQGLQDLAFLGGTQISAWLVSTGLTIALAFSGFRLWALAVGWVAAQVVSASIWTFRLLTRFPGVLPARLPSLSWSTARGQLAGGFWVSLAQVAQALLSGTEIVVIGRILGPAAVVPFVCTAKLVSVLANQPQILMQSAAPALSEMKVSESRARLFQVCVALTQGMLLLSGAVACVVLAVNQGFVGWWVGANQFGGLRLTFLLVVCMLLRHWNTTSVYAIFCFGYERRISLTTLLDGLVTVSGMLVLVRLFGPIGAPLGSVLGVALVSLPGNLSALRRETGTGMAPLLRPLWPWLWRLLILGTGSFTVAAVWAPRTPVGLAATTAAIGLAYVAVMAPLARLQPLSMYVPPWLAAFTLKPLRAPMAKRADA